MDIEIPNKPPIEIARKGELWVVEEYRQGKRDGPTFSTHDTQMDAVRTAKAKMDDDAHPCVIRWESDESVTNVYWNPLFESVELRFDELVERWSIVPEASTCAIRFVDGWQEAYRTAKDVQREYNFKYLRAYDHQSGDKGEGNYTEREHRFLRNDITKSGVRFDREKVEALSEHTQRKNASSAESAAAETERTKSDSPESGIAVTRAATPGMLGVSVPDVTKVEFLDTDGIVHKYATPWGDGTNAEIIALSQKYATHEGIRDAFTAHLEPWKNAVDSQNVASIYENGTDPTPWVAYRAGEHALPGIGHDLPMKDRIRIIDGIVEGIETVTGTGAVVCGLHPENLRLWNVRGSWRVGIANWGIEWAVNQVLDASIATPVTAPEQLEGQITETTIVYQFGAIVQWLLCESYPVTEDAGPAQILEGTRNPPNTRSDIPSAVEAILDTALATDPTQRYENASVFHDELTEAL